MRTLIFLIVFSAAFIIGSVVQACSVVYYKDAKTGKIYVANNEDYWYDTEAHIQIEPGKDGEFSRLWYGWDDFAQGGVNEAGLFFDGAVTPQQTISDGFKKIKGNLGDEILANCHNVEQALGLLKQKNVGLTNAHMMIGDSSGNAVVIEWTGAEMRLTWISEGHLTMTNFLLSDTTAGNYPCHRYKSIEENISQLRSSKETITLNKFGNVINRAVQVPQTDERGKIGGTLYSSFINITDMEFVLVYKLDNTKVTKLDLKYEFQNTWKSKKIKLN
ncbi:MAG TPA: penicillin acylase [Cytophagales bacterium]|jgi:predicted choloylglycine hydrolase|nr:penicillin acylase [Cytophagales bacterium]